MMMRNSCRWLYAGPGLTAHWLQKALTGEATEGVIWKTRARGLERPTYLTAAVESTVSLAFRCWSLADSGSIRCRRLGPLVQCRRDSDCRCCRRRVVRRLRTCTSFLSVKGSGPAPTAKASKLAGPPAVGL
jgi:hypothetical protein